MNDAPPAPDAASSGAIYRRLLGYTRPYRWLGLLALVGMVVEAAAAGAFTALMEPLVDETFVARSPAAAVWLPLAIVALFTLRGLATFVTDYGMARIGRGVVQALRQQVLEKYLRMPSTWFDREPAGALVSRLSYNTEQVAQASSDALKVMVTDALTLVALLTVMLMQSVKVTLTMLVMGPLIAGIIAVVGRRYRRINQRIQESVESLTHLAEQAVAGHQEIRVHGAQAAQARRFEAMATRNRRLQVKVEATKAVSSSLVQLLSAIALAIIVWVAGLEAMAGRLKPGEFVSLMTAMMAMLPSLKRLTNVQGMVQKGVAAAASLFMVLDAEDEPDRGTRPLARARGEIGFDAVTVRYPGAREPALDGVSFDAAPGTVTAIVGRSGSGKSTLVRLLPRLYPLSAGAVRLDGVSIEEYRLHDLRRQVAYVSQHVVLFDDTVAANIAFGLAEASRADIEAAAEAANAAEFVRRLPAGYDTPLGAGGVTLSGGQRQRIAIARAILRDAPILILDEATSALDSESERLVQEALARLCADRTTLVIAHRLSTVEHADQVVVLDRGRLVERGRHAELLARGGVYAQLHRLQFREPPE